MNDEKGRECVGGRYFCEVRNITDGINFQGKSHFGDTLKAFHILVTFCKELYDFHIKINVLILPFDNEFSGIIYRFFRGWQNIF